MRFIGDITTPWPCFMLAATKEFLDANVKEVESLLKALREACGHFHDAPGMADVISQNYGLKPEDAKECENFHCLVLVIFCRCMLILL